MDFDLGDIPAKVLSTLYNGIPLNIKRAEADMKNAWDLWEDKQSKTTFYFENSDKLLLYNLRDYLNGSRITFENRIPEILGEPKGTIFIFRSLSGYASLLLAALGYKICAYDPYRLCTNLLIKFSSILGVQSNVTICNNIVQARRSLVNNKIQGVVSIGGFELESDPATMLDDLYKTLKPGAAIIMIPYLNLPVRVSEQDKYDEYNNYKSRLKRVYKNYRYPEVYAR